jgi:hypothetical protein
MNGHAEVTLRNFIKKCHTAVCGNDAKVTICKPTPYFVTLCYALRMQLTHTHTSANDGKFQWHRSRLMRTAIHSVALILSAGMRVLDARLHIYLIWRIRARDCIHTKNSAPRKKKRGLVRWVIICWEFSSALDSSNCDYHARARTFCIDATWVGGERMFIIFCVCVKRPTCSVRSHSQALHIIWIFVCLSTLSLAALSALSCCAEFLLQRK